MHDVNSDNCNAATTCAHSEHCPSPEKSSFISTRTWSTCWHTRADQANLLEDALSLLATVVFTSLSPNSSNAKK